LELSLSELEHSLPQNFQHQFFTGVPTALHLFFINNSEISFMDDHKFIEICNYLADIKGSDGKRTPARMNSRGARWHEMRKDFAKMTKPFQLDATQENLLFDRNFHSRKLAAKNNKPTPPPELKAVIPKSMVHGVIERFHSNKTLGLHSGRYVFSLLMLSQPHNRVKTLLKVNSGCHMPNADAHVAAFIKECMFCQQVTADS
jgi:hypothetical protein